MLGRRAPDELTLEFEPGLQEGEHFVRCRAHGGEGQVERDVVQLQD